jgi:hypothetical protein
MTMKTGWKSCLVFCGLLILRPLFGQPQVDLQLSQIQLAKVPAIGKQIDIPKKAVQMLCMVNSAQLDRCMQATVDGIKYTIAFRQRHGKDYYVTRVDTTDAKFKSPDGLHVGDEITVNGPEDIFEAPYFEVYAKNKTQWIPIVGYLGKANVVINGKSGNMKDVETIWPNGRDSVRLLISGFVLHSSSRAPMSR